MLGTLATGKFLGMVEGKFSLWTGVIKRKADQMDRGQFLEIMEAIGRF